MKTEPNSDIIKFLLGENDFWGLWFGDAHPSEQGSFWWRKHLRAELTALKTEKEELVKELELIKSAFNDRVEIIGMQLGDKNLLESKLARQSEVLQKMREALIVLGVWVSGNDKTGSAGDIYMAAMQALQSHDELLNGNKI